jgi:hypothetical protein
MKIFDFLPVAHTGTEILHRDLPRLRRASVRVRVGEPFSVPPLNRGPRKEELRAATDLIKFPPVIHALPRPGACSAIEPSTKGAWLPGRRGRWPLLLDFRSAAAPTLHLPSPRSLPDPVADDHVPSSPGRGRVVRMRLPRFSPNTTCPP